MRSTLIPFMNWLLTNSKLRQFRFLVTCLRDHSRKDRPMYMVVMHQEKSQRSISTDDDNDICILSFDLYITVYLGFRPAPKSAVWEPLKSQGAGFVAQNMF